MGVPSVDISDLIAWVEDLLRSGDRLLLGITGPPGVGKSTVAADFAAKFDAPIVGLDGFHLAQDVLLARNWLDRKGAPHTFDAHGFVALLGRLSQQDPAETIYAPKYDRAARNPIGSAVPIGCDDNPILIEGNYLLLPDSPWNQIRSILDRIIYLDLEDAARIERLVARHIRFGKEPDRAREFVMRSDEANARIVAATRDRADLIVRLW